MKVLTATLAIIAMTYSFELLAKAPKPTEKRDGIYAQKVGEGASTLFYTVDTKSKLCFVTPGGGAALTNIKCDELKNREEWRDIIDW